MSLFNFVGISRDFGRFVRFRMTLWDFVVFRLFYFRNFQLFRKFWLILLGRIVVAISCRVELALRGPFLTEPAGNREKYSRVATEEAVAAGSVV